ncbi:MAG: hypothetical protein HYV09_03990 [Deltaproteobacteria bacterium]|nr:hypothetical protein [Deltaproteobacteria bacterium]
MSVPACRSVRAVRVWKRIERVALASALLTVACTRREDGDERALQGVDDNVRDFGQLNGIFGDNGTSIGEGEGGSDEEARGGGPPEARDRSWPFQARARLVKARCDAAARCTGESRRRCAAREEERLASWPIDACTQIDVRPCIESVRIGCSGVSWQLPLACRADRVCLPVVSKPLE